MVMDQSSSKTGILDAPLQLLGFKFEGISATRVHGHLPVTQHCVQPFGVLHGGISALIAEALASIGAVTASGYKRVAGIHLKINHLTSAHLGDTVFAEATPLDSSSQTIQVWEVRLWKVDASSSDGKTLVSSSNVTLLCNMPVPERAKDVSQTFKSYSKL